MTETHSIAAHAAGTWPSPISSESLTSSFVRLLEPRWNGSNIRWNEWRAEEGGRYVVVESDCDGNVRTCTSQETSVRTRVHEYGGAAARAFDGRSFYFNDVDQRVYLEQNNEVRAITPAINCHYADFELDARRDRLFCIRQDHRSQNREPINALVTIPLDEEPNEGWIVDDTADFVAWPRLSPDGRQLAWIRWKHPNMPWDATELCLAPLTEKGAIGEPIVIAGDADCSVTQPQWGPDGMLYYISDHTGCWNVYQHTEDGPEAILPLDEDCTRPDWKLGQSTYQVLSPDEVLIIVCNLNGNRLVRVNHATDTRHTFDLPFVTMSDLHVHDNNAVMLAESVDEPARIIRLSLDDDSWITVAEAGALPCEKGMIPEPEHITFPTTGGIEAQGFYYQPTHTECAVDANEKPPLLVRCHGGPTSAATMSLDLEVAYWTSRGWAVVNVNYGGSTGLGRPYRQRLKNEWGIMDVDDCANAASFLIDRGDVDPQRIAITGGSAGGYTTLCALARTDIFKAGCVSYGISDLGTFTEQTHKFESHYMHGLIGPWPRATERYRYRSPINKVKDITAPLLFFQGTEDKVVPPDQTRLMVEALVKRDMTVACEYFEGEQHGFRHASSVHRALDGAQRFFADVFDMAITDDIKPITYEQTQLTDEDVDIAPSLDDETVVADPESNPPSTEDQA